MIMKDLMVDLETLNNTPNSAVVSACFIMFDITSGEYAVHYNCNVSLQSSLDSGLTIKEETFYWWLNNSQSARNSINPNQNSNPTVSLDALYNVISGVKFDQIWSRGADFDIAILRNIFEKLNKPDIINRKGRCVRTMQEVAPYIYEHAVSLYKQSLPAFTEHDALHDSIAQIKGVSAVYNHINRPQ